MIANKVIRVIAPSQSWQTNKNATYLRGVRRLQLAGYKVEYGANIKQHGEFGTASIQHRIADLHAAFADNSVSAIMCLDGGWSANQLLPYINWELLRNNPKPVIGYSDCTVLLNAIYAKTNQTAYYGPTLTTLGELETGDISLKRLESALYDTSCVLADDSAYELKDKPSTADSTVSVLSYGSAEGVLFGGNLGSLYLLQGTPYMPVFCRDTILFIEDDDEAGKNTAKELDRRLESILQQVDALQFIKGVMVGKYQATSGVSRKTIEAILKIKFGSSIPIVYDVGFGHTMPMASLCIGGKFRMDVTNKGRTRLYGI